MMGNMGESRDEFIILRNLVGGERKQSPVMPDPSAMGLVCGATIKMRLARQTG